MKTLIFELPANKLQRLLDAQIIAKLKLSQPVQLIHFVDCIKCDHTIKDLI